MYFTKATIAAVAAFLAQGFALPHAVRDVGCPATRPSNVGQPAFNGISPFNGQAPPQVQPGGWPGSWQPTSAQPTGTQPTGTQPTGTSPDQTQDNKTGDFPAFGAPNVGGNSGSNNQMLFASCLAAQKSCKNEADADEATCNTRVGDCCENQVSECQKVADNEECKSSAECQNVATAQSCIDLRNNCFATVGLPLPGAQ